MSGTLRSPTLHPCMSPEPFHVLDGGGDEDQGAVTLVTTWHSTVVQTKSSTRSLRLWKLTLLLPTRRPFQVLEETPPHVHMARAEQTLYPPCSLQQPSSGQPGYNMAPAACGSLSLNFPLTVTRHLDRAYPEVTPLSSGGERCCVLSPDQCRAPSWGHREGARWERGLLPRCSDESPQKKGDGFSLDSTSHPSPASPPWSQAPQAPSSSLSLYCLL